MRKGKHTGQVSPTRSGKIIDEKIFKPSNKKELINLIYKINSPAHIKGFTHKSIALVFLYGSRKDTTDRDLFVLFNKIIPPKTSLHKNLDINQFEINDFFCVTFLLCIN